MNQFRAEQREVAKAGASRVGSGSGRPVQGAAVRASTVRAVCACLLVAAAAPAASPAPPASRR